MTQERSAEYRYVEVRRDAGILTLTLARPERKNALSPVLINELLWALDEARDDPSVRALVLTGAGSSFCVGADLEEMLQPSADGELAPKGDLSALLLRFPLLDKPVIARVNGDALGGGLGLVASCQFAIASEGARLGTPEIQRGLFPMQVMALLDRLIPRRALYELTLLGETVSATRAAELGLVSEVVAEGELDEAVARLASALSERSPTAMRAGLRALHAQEGKPLEESLPLLRARLEELLSTPDAIEGLSAVLQHRRPTWGGR